MKQWITGLVLLLAGTNLRAQSSPKTFIELFGGQNSISGNFAGSTYDNATSGFARPGYVFGAQGAFFFSKHLGLGVTLSQARYGVNTFALADGYRQDFAVDEATAASKQYTFNNLLAGPYYALARGRFTLEVRGLAGLSAATLPALRVALEDQSTFTQQQATATAFAYQVGAGLRVRLIRHAGIALRADYFSTKPKFVVTYDNVNNRAGRTLADYNQPVRSLMGTLAVFYQFGQ